MIKKIIVFPVILVVIALLVTSFDSTENFSMESSNEPSEELVFHVPHVDELPNLAELPSDHNLVDPGKSYVGFKEAIAFKESGGRYGIVNPYGYWENISFPKVL